VLFRRQLVQLDRLSRIAGRDGRKAMTRAEIIRALIDGLVGSHINLTVIRDGKRRTLTASTIERTLEADKENTTNNNEEAAPARNKLGMSVQELTPALRQSYGIPDNVNGVVVTGVKEVSPAGDVLSEGDVISEVAGEKVTNLAQFRAAIDHLRPGQTARIYVTSAGRGGNSALSGYRFIHVP
jgi:serine protease Do